MDKYSKSSSLPQHLEIHWFSIINSCVTVLLLTGFLVTILMRVLKNDFIKYSHDEESTDDQEETGWKYIHGDVFRYPPHKSLFCAVLGSGTQLFTLAIFIFMLALVILQPLSIVSLKASTELGELASKWLMPSVHTKSKRDHPGAINPLHQVIQVQYPRPTAKHQRRVKVFIQMPSGRVQATYEQSFPDFQAYC